MMAARYGIARGLFSNESGLGSAPIVAAAARTRNPVRQALVSSTGTFWDTVVVCAMTGIVIVSSMLRDPAAFAGLRGNGALFTKAAFSQIPYVGPTVLVVGLFTFVFSTILGWSYYGERAMEYLCGKKAILPYRVAWVIAVYVGSVMTTAAGMGPCRCHERTDGDSQSRGAAFAQQSNRCRNAEVSLERHGLTIQGD